MSMYRIRTYNNIAPRGLERLSAARFEVAPKLTDADGIVLRSHSLHDEPIDEQVLVVARAGAGVNNIPVADFTRRGIVVFNTPGANANAVKELVAAALLLTSRDIFGGMQFAQSLAGIDDPAEMGRRMEREKKRFAGSEIYGKTLGVVGLGAIGSLVANMALDLGMEVYGFDPAISVEAAWRLSSQVHKMDSLQALLQVSDFVTLHVPDLEATRHLINEESLAWFRPGSRLLNFARERIVDTPALINALDAGTPAVYTTDFPTPELVGRPNVLLLPHIGASTAEAEENCAVMAANQLIDFLIHGNIVNSVNFPRTVMNRHGGHRITFANANVPKVLGRVLAILADSNNNVIDLVNKSRDEIAYNIVDVEDPPGPDIIAAIRAVENVNRVRVLPDIPAQS